MPQTEQQKPNPRTEQPQDIRPDQKVSNKEPKIEEPKKPGDHKPMDVNEQVSQERNPRH